MAGQRPGGVTLVAVIIWIWSALDVIAGILAIIAASMQTSLVVDLGVGFGFDLLWGGILTLVLGIIGFIIAGGLLKGSRVARMLVTIWLVISIISAIISLASGAIVGGIISLVIGIIGILLLWAGRAGQFFARS